VYAGLGRARAFHLFGIILIGMALPGCALLDIFRPVERPELPVPLEITMGAAERVNPTAAGRPSPIVVRLFELSNDAQFLSADYFVLMGQGGVPLGEEMLTNDEYNLLPGETRMVRRRAALNSRFLGVVAGYRDLTGSTWRAVAPLPAPYLAGRVWSNSESPTKRLYVVLGERGVAIYEEQPGK
jgi:type VI secretion system protein VasD